MPDDLVETADPKQSLGLTADVPERPVQLGGTLEERQLARTLFSRSRVLVAAQQEPRMHQPAAGHGQFGFRRVKVPVSLRQRSGIASEDSSLIEQPGLPDPPIHAAASLPVSALTPAKRIDMPTHAHRSG